jgi:hypothetical protein
MAMVMAVVTGYKENPRFYFNMFEDKRSINVSTYLSNGVNFLNDEKLALSTIMQIRRFPSLIFADRISIHYFGELHLILPTVMTALTYGHNSSKKGLFPSPALGRASNHAFNTLLNSCGFSR